MSPVFRFAPRTEPASSYSSADTQRSGRVAEVPSLVHPIILRKRLGYHSRRMVSHLQRTLSEFVEATREHFLATDDLSMLNGHQEANEAFAEALQVANERRSKSPAARQA
jgi:hypothetical protein